MRGADEIEQLETEEKLHHHFSHWTRLFLLTESNPVERHNNRCCCGSGWEPHLPAYTMNICVVISDHLTRRATPPTGTLQRSDWWVAAVNVQGAVMKSA